MTKQVYIPSLNLELPLGKITFITGNNNSKKEKVIGYLCSKKAPIKSISNIQPITANHSFCIINWNYFPEDTSEIKNEVNSILEIDCFENISKESFKKNYFLNVFTIVFRMIVNKDSTIIIKNPENYLHQSVQRNLMIFIIKKAIENNHQIIIETESDIIFNESLIAVKHELINPSDIKVLHFYNDNYVIKYYDIEVLEGGRIKTQPIDFFDSIDKQLTELIGF